MLGSFARFPCAGERPDPVNRLGMANASFYALWQTIRHETNQLTMITFMALRQLASECFSAQRATMCACHPEHDCPAEQSDRIAKETYSLRRRRRFTAYSIVPAGIWEKPSCGHRPVGWNRPVSLHGST